MVFITSITPDVFNYENQKKAILSWINLGGVVFSLNGQEEFSQLKDKFPEVKFILTDQVMEEHGFKPLVKVNALLDYGYKQNLSNLVCIINSDIELICSGYELLLYKEKAKEGIVIVSRHDYEKEDKSDLKLEKFGFDVFIMEKETIKLIPRNDFYMGCCFWDYWIPYHVWKKGGTIVNIQRPFAYHKKHSRTWNRAMWERFVSLFRQENGIHTGTFRSTSKKIRFGFMASAQEIV